MQCEEEFSEEAFLAESIQDLNLRLDLKKIYLYLESPNIFQGWKFKANYNFDFRF